MKLRNPREFSAAITRIRGELGEDACARAVGRSASLIRKWADPDHASLPGLEQALLLDAAYVAAGHGEAPLLKLYEALLEDAVSDNDVGRDELVPSALMLQAIVGDLSEAIREVVDPVTGSANNAMTPERQSRILTIIDRLEEETDRLEDAVEADD